MADRERTSGWAASRAGKIRSALTQRAAHLVETSRGAASAASRMLANPKSSAATKSGAASALTQRPNKRGR